MKISVRKRVMALGLALMMIVGMVPAHVGVVTKAEETGATVNFDLDSVALADDGQGSLKKAFTAEALIGDVPVVATSVKTLEVSEVSKDGITDENGKPLKRKLSLMGKGSKSERCVKIIVPYRAMVTVFAMSGGNDERTINVEAQDGTLAATLPAAAKGTVAKAESATLAAGTYYLYSANKGIDIFDIDIQRTLLFDLSAAEAKDYTDAEVALGDFAAGTDGNKISIAAAEGVDDPSGSTFIRKLSLGGSGNATKRYVKFELPFAAEVSVTVMSGGADERTLQVERADGVKVTTLPIQPKGSVAKNETISLAAGTYYLYSVNKGADIYDISVKRAVNFDLSAAEAKDYTNTEVALGDFAAGTDGNKISIAASEGVSDPSGNAFARKLSLGGSGSITKRYVKFSLDFVTTLDVYAMSGGDDERTLNITDPSGKVVATVLAQAKGAVAQPQSVTLRPGNYVMYSGSKGIDIYDICVKPDTKPMKSWAEVEAPVITGVTQDEEGNFVVAFTADIDKYEGAEYVIISMCYGGKEASFVKVAGKDTQVVMTPHWSGDYTFTASAVRTGESHKTSDVVEVKGYSLALKKPVFQMLQNEGDGTVYVDWVNNERADSYTVEYKADGASEYIVAGTTADGHYTLKGLTVGSAYEVKVTAKSSSENLAASYGGRITVTAEPGRQWYAAITGSAQKSDITVKKADESSDNYKFSVEDSTAQKSNYAEAANVSNTTGSVEIKGDPSGKISDDEDGFQYYFTRINPNTENFSLTATFAITDVSLVPDGQTGFGVFAADTLGIHQFGPGDYVHKYFNSIACLYYNNKAKGPSMRVIEGYSNPNTSNNDGAERINSNTSLGTEGQFEVGKRYTFTLEKTNDAFVAKCDGKELRYSNTGLLSMQEDGSLCIGVMVSRKISANITDIKFATSGSTGVASKAKEEKTTPDTRIYSTGTSGAAAYELIYASNVAGTLKVTAPDGTDLESVAMEADSVARINVPVYVGTNIIASVFTPDAGEELTSYEDIKKDVTVVCRQYGKAGETIVAAPDGKADAKGTQEEPLDLATAVQYAQPGQTILLKDGTYTQGVTIQRSVCGTQESSITLRPETAGGVVFDGAGLTIIGSYWHIYGLYVKNAPGVGIQIAGNHNVIEMCTVEASKNSGVQISRQGGSPTNAQGIKGQLWPSYNLIKNCESFDNCDAGRNDADGFAAKLTCGEGNVFYGCISHNNIDDGWDLYAKSVSGMIGAVTIENCVAYDNGWLSKDDIASGTYKFGEGNGFKLGGGYLKGGHVLRNSIAFNNHAKGITSNSCPDCEIYNCISYGNSAQGGNAYNVGLNFKDSGLKEWIVEGLISMSAEAKTNKEDMIPFALQNENNYIYNGSASFNTQGVQAKDDWFESVDVSVKPTRNANGSINMNGLLSLKAGTAPKDTGAILDLASEKAVSVLPTAGKVVAEVVESADVFDANASKTPEAPANPEAPGAPVAPEMPGVPDAPGQNGGTATGDKTKLTTVILVVSASGGILVALAGFAFFSRKKKKQQDNQSSDKNL